MTIPIKQKVIPVALLLTAFLFFASRDRREPGGPPSATPDDTLIEMVELASRGDVGRWLQCFGGNLGSQLARVAQDRGSAELAEQLRRRSHAIKGFAIVGREPQSGNQVRMTTETVYSDKNTRQVFQLSLQQGRWRIVASDFELVSDWQNDYGRHIR